jgi:hypothetical protein
LPDDWTCPVCGTEKQFFQSKAKRVAGFEQNQGYGLGSNSLTSEQKSILIYGALSTTPADTIVNQGFAHS